MSASAYTVMDPVNKYRHGVLVGNFVEDKFGIDLNQKVLFPSFRDLFKMLLKLRQINLHILSIVHFIREILSWLHRRNNLHNSMLLLSLYMVNLYI